MDNQGWVKIHRSLLKWEWSDECNTGWLFISCLMLANYEDKKWHGIVVKRGSFITSYKKLAKQVGTSVRSLRTSLTRLKTTGELTQSHTHKYSVITVCNYDQYQITTHQTTNKRHSSDTVATTTKNNKNKKNKEREIERKAVPLAGYRSREYLCNIPKEDLVKFGKAYNCTTAQIIQKGEALYLWLEKKGRQYKNYRAALQDALLRDYGHRTQRETYVVPQGVEVRING